MSKNQHESNASELWLYFNSVINWVQTIFPNYRKEMKGVNWGELYNKHRNNKFNIDEIEKEVKKLMIDEDVTKKSGIYSYIFTKEEKYLNIRSFTNAQKRETYEKQNGVCPQCSKSDNHYDLDDMEADHITPWTEGGKTITENCQMLCREHNRMKSNI